MKGEDKDSREDLNCSRRTFNERAECAVDICDRRRTGDRVEDGIVMTNKDHV